MGLHVTTCTNHLWNCNSAICLQGESCAAVGYKLELGALTMRGRVDSHGTVGAVVERRLDPLPATLLLSGHINHWTDDSRFGVALMVG